MKQPKTIYINEKWLAFSEKVKRRDGKCLQCNRGPEEVTLQIHHNIYIPGKAPWNYAISDCLTLCKGCHAKEHGLVEPDRGWSLLSIDDLGGLDGTCERKGCGAEIRYEHLTYHPNWGYLVVGSTCIEHLRQEDRLLSNNAIHLYKNISNFVHSSEWSRGTTKNGQSYISSAYKHHQIRIYGEESFHSFQLKLKEKGIRWHSFGKVIQAKGKSTLSVKELAYITLRGTISESSKEKELLRNIYRAINKDT